MRNKCTKVLFLLLLHISNQAMLNSVWSFVSSFVGKERQAFEKKQKLFLAIRQAAQVGDWLRQRLVSTISRILISDRLMVGVKNECGATPLHLACCYGDKGIVELLIKHGASVNTKDEEGLTPLHDTCDRGNRELALLLLSHGAVVDEPDLKGNTALTYACQKGNLTVIELLLSYGASKFFSGKINQSVGNEQVQGMLKKHVRNTRIKHLRRILNGSQDDDSDKLVQASDEEEKKFIPNEILEMIIDFEEELLKDNKDDVVAVKAQGGAASADH